MPMSEGAALAKKKLDDLKLLEELFEKRGITIKEIEEILGIGVAELGDTEKYFEAALNYGDRGFGSFGRCLHILYLTDGNKKETERILSRFILKEGKSMK